jgi:hypothetical protein
LALVAALLSVLVFAVAASARPAEPMAPSVPNLPHCFYGQVTSEAGTALPGAGVIARGVQGWWKGQWPTPPAVTDGLGRYGWDGQFCIPGYDSADGSGAKTGDKIAFNVNGTQAYLYDVAKGVQSNTYTFTYGGNTQLNLIVPVQMTINATAGPNGTISPAGSVSVPLGGNQTFTFSAAPGYQVDQVLVDGVANPAAAAAGSYTFTNVTSDHTIHVTFIKSTYTITVTAGEGCAINPPGNQVVNLYSSILFTVAPQTGYTLVDVVVDGISKGPMPEVAFVNVTADHAFSATCARQSFTITPSAGAGGTITPSTPQTVLFGDDVTFTMQPNGGYTVEDVLVNGVSVGPVTTYTFDNVAANGTISVTFKKTELKFKLFLPITLVQQP